MLRHSPALDNGLEVVTEDRELEREPACRNWGRCISLPEDLLGGSSSSS